MQTKVRAREILGNTIGAMTNWCIITGAPSSGKTMVLKELTALGYHTSHDVSRAHLEKQLQKVGDKYKIREDQRNLQNNILWEMILTEATLPQEETVFLEYALPDNLAFWKISELSWTSEVLHASVRFRYKHVFMLDSLPPDQDPIRTETSCYQDAMNSELKTVYFALGYNPITIPIASPADRVKTILQILKGKTAKE